MEILIPMATAAFQSLSVGDAGAARSSWMPTGRPMKIDSCYAYGAQRELVRAAGPSITVLHRRGMVRSLLAA